MADFLSTEWFQSLNDSLEHADSVPFESGAATVRVVIEFPDAPSNDPMRLRSRLAPTVRVSRPGDHLAADAIVQIAYADASALTNGDVDSASALRDGRVKVRGDVNAIVPLRAAPTSTERQLGSLDGPAAAPRRFRRTGRPRGAHAAPTRRRDPTGRGVVLLQRTP